MKRTYRIMQISDMQVGSRYAIFPENFMSKEGNPFGLSSVQNQLLMAWKDMIKNVPEVDILILNGDITDGIQRASGGREVLTTDLDEQVEAACELLKPLVKKASRTYVISGTKYHEAINSDLHHAIALNLSRTGADVTFAGDVLNLEVGGRVINATHHIGVASGLYSATPLDREGVWAKLRGGKRGVPKADIVLRAHTHQFVHVEHSTLHIIVGPAWQTATPYTIEKSYYRMRPDIGWFYFEFAEGENMDFKLIKRLYPIESHADTVRHYVPRSP